MPNKKNKNSRYNGLYWYMKEILPTLKREGRVHGGIQEAVIVALPMYKRLPKEEQDRYDKIAKEMKKRDQDELCGLPKYRDDSERFDNAGNIIADRKENDEEIRKDRLQNRKWAKTLWPREPEDVLDMKFYFISYEHLCKTEMDGVEQYLPLEVALLEYSMREGIIDTWHKFIDPGGIPMGYRFTCIQHSEDTHGIPVERFELADNNYRSLFEEMERFVGKDGATRDFPPVYCREIEYKSAISSTNWLYYKATRGQRRNNLAKVFHIEDCIQDLASKAGSNVSDTATMDLVQSSVFDYSANTRCQWHEDKEVKHCALGTVKKLAYLISDFFANDEMYSFELTPRHIPQVDDKFEECIIPGSRVRMEPVRPVKRAEPRLEEQQNNGPFASRDIRYKQDKVVVPLSDEEEEEEDDLESLCTAYSTVSDFVSESDRKKKGEAPLTYERPNTRNMDDFPALGVPEGRISASARVPARMVSQEETETRVKMPEFKMSESYLAVQREREAALASQPTLQEVMKEKKKLTTEQKPTVDTMPGIGRGQAVNAVHSQGRPPAEPRAIGRGQFVPTKQPVFNKWTQGAKRATTVTTTEQKPGRSITVPAGQIGVGRGAWVPRDTTRTTQESSPPSLGITRPPPGFGRGFKLSD